MQLNGSESSRVIRWGILGTGRIAGVFATGLATTPGATLLAVGSRSATAVTSFADRFAVPRRYAAYDDLANDPDLDVIYVATPHNFHHEHARLCLAAGKAVLLEKPFTINATEAASVVHLARERGLFLMEAMWTRFLPIIVRARTLINAGAIGEPLMITSDFGFRTEVNPASRLFDPAMGGGALLDVGVYPVSIASMVFGEPQRIAGLAQIGTTGVDEQAAVALDYGAGRMAVIWTATRTQSPMETVINGSAGRIRIHPPSWAATRLTLSNNDGEQLIELPFDGNGYTHEAAEVGQCLRSGLTESPQLPLDETLSVMRTLDAIRAQWGLRYPME